MRGISDVRPELARVVDVEGRTASAYGAAVDRFEIGRLTAEALAKLIERTIIPELQATHARLEAINGVPPEHQPLVAAAKEYCGCGTRAGTFEPKRCTKGAWLPLRALTRSSDRHWKPSRGSSPPNQSEFRAGFRYSCGAV